MNTHKIYYLIPFILLGIWSPKSVAQINFEQNLQMEDARISLYDSPLWFYDDNDVLRTTVYTDTSGAFWFTGGTSTNILSGDLQLWAGAGINSDPSLLSSDIVINSNDDVIITLDDNVAENHNESGEFKILSGSSAPRLSFSESGHMEIIQGFDPSWPTLCNFLTPGSNVGLTLTPTSGKKVNMYVDGSDLNFLFDNQSMSFIQDSNGKYFSADNCNSSFKANTSKGKNRILEKIKSLKIGMNNNKSIDRDLLIEPASLQKEFPSSVVLKEGSYAIAHSDFGLISLKAIQEQQEYIMRLEREIEELKSQMSQVLSGLNNGE